jgi:membrane protease YdiL (CAAX protease family)
VALSATFVSSIGLILAVAAWRTSGNPAALQREAERFALSASGMMACAFMEAVVLATLAIARSRAAGAPSSELRLALGRASPFGVAQGAIALVALSAVCGALIERFRGSSVDVTGTLAAALDARAPLRVLFAVASIGLAPAFAEELFFRGLLQTELRRTWGRWASITLTAAGFGVFHWDRAQGLVAFAAGLLLGWLAERFESIWPCITAHAANNVAFVTMAVVSRGAHASSSIELWIVPAGALVFVLSLLGLKSAISLRAPAPAMRASALSAAAPEP